MILFENKVRKLMKLHHMFIAMQNMSKPAALLSDESCQLLAYALEMERDSSYDFLNTNHPGAPSGPQAQRLFRQIGRYTIKENDKIIDKLMIRRRRKQKK